MLSSNKLSMTSPSLMVFVMLQMLLLQASADMSLSISPALIHVGLSPSLEVNCTFSFNTSSAMADIISLTVSRGNNTVLASITSYSDHQVNVISSEGITADGVINPGDQSYIHLHWDYPTDTQQGTYLCIARGIDIDGHNIETINTSVVTVDQIDLQDLVDELAQMKLEMQKMQTSCSQEIQQMQTSITQLEWEMQAQLDMHPIFLRPPLSYNNKQYFVSQAPFQDFNESISICKAYGGILAEMDDLDEYHAVQNYMKTLSGVDLVCIGGTDQGHDQTWVLPSSNDNLPVVDWANGEPTNGNDFNCLTLYKDQDWKMYSYHCHMSELNWYRYMCEL